MCLICRNESLEEKSVIDCKGCQELTALPPLPAELRELDCSHCSRLTALPPLPPGLEVLSCSYCPIRSIPTLPPGMLKLFCSYCPLLTSIPLLPPGVRTLFCQYCPLFTSAPSLPQGETALGCWTTTPWMNHRLNPYFQANIRLLRILQKKLKIKLWKRRLTKSFYLKKFPREISNLILSF